MNARDTLSVGTSALMAVMLVAGCHSAPTRLFTLYGVAAASSRNAYAGPPVRIDAVHVPPALDRIEVVGDIAPGEESISDLDHWSAPLGQVARQALAADLVTRLPEGRVIFPHLSKPAGALGISVDVLDISSDSRGTTLLASWIVTPAGALVRSAGGTVTLHTDLASHGAAATAQALSALLGQLADRIAADL